MSKEEEQQQNSITMNHITIFSINVSYHGFIEICADEPNSRNKAILFFEKWFTRKFPNENPPVQYAIYQELKTATYSKYIFHFSKNYSEEHNLYHKVIPLEVDGELIE